MKKVIFVLALMAMMPIFTNSYSQVTYCYENEAYHMPNGGCKSYAWDCSLCVEVGPIE